MTLPPDAHEVPALPGHWLFGSLAELQDDYLGTLLRASRELGPVVRIHAGPPGWRETLYSVSSPELAAEILGNPDRFSKDEPGYRQIREALGNGMLTSEGAVWRRQRRMLAPIFTPRRISRSYIAIMVDEAQLLADRWRNSAGDNMTVDMSADMLQLASRTIGRILYGSDMATALPQVMRLDYINEEMLRRSVSRHPLPMWVPTPANRKLKDGLRALRRLVADIIATRRAQGDEGATDGMLGLLLSARDAEQDSGPLTDEEVVNQVLVFMLAGHDTTSTTLACSLVELARHPVWQQKVHEELQQELGDRPPSAYDATHLPWTGWVAREAMRLYPASHSSGRSPVGDQIVGGYLLPAGSTVVISTYALHRALDSWDRPDEFDPGRYDVADGVVAGGHKHAWMAFGSGPHTCVGMTLATQMVTVVLATLLQQVQLSTALTSVPVHASMTLRPAGALPVEVNR